MFPSCVSKHTLSSYMSRNLGQTIGFEFGSKFDPKTTKISAKMGLDASILAYIYGLN